MKSALKAKANDDLRAIMAAVLGSLAVAGCGGAENIAGKVISGGQEPIEISPDAFAAPVYCPSMQLQSDSYLIMKFERGKEDVPEGLIYQATLTNWANDCSREGTDQTRVKVGLTGEVTPGPAWKGGEITLPVRVAIIGSSDSKKPAISELIKVPVQVGANAPAQAWTVVEDKFVIPRDQQMKIVFGFDEGPKKR